MKATTKRALWKIHKSLILKQFKDPNISLIIDEEGNYKTEKTKSVIKPSKEFLESFMISSEIAFCK